MSIPEPSGPRWQGSRAHRGGWSLSATGKFSLLGVFDRIVREGDKILYHYVLIDFLCRRTAGELHPGSDADEVLWFREEELKPLNLAQDTEDVIRRALREANGRKL